jgi:hypothetical protein
MWKQRGSQAFTLVSCPAKTTAPMMLLVLRRLEPRSRMEAGESAIVPERACALRRIMLPVNVYSEALGCSQWISPCTLTDALGQ